MQVRRRQLPGTSMAWSLAVIVAVLAALGLALGSAAPRPPALASLPGLPGEAPVLAPPTLPEDQARASNAAIPFVPGPHPAARPFRFAGSSEDRARATECLALAAMAEAGPSDEGQRAVIQVVLNRVRHPAFAATVCGVVFEGAERQTGCQFSFTCDGSLVRRYGDAAWAASRRRAAEALGGRVYAPVSTATHYHTDWVFPYWSPRLDKIAQVETHLFLRWPGYWGTRAAFSRAYRGGEPDPTALAGPPAAETPEPEPGAAPTVAPGAPAISGGELVMRDPSGRANFVHLAPGTGEAGALDLARRLCGPSGTCRVLGWTDRSAIPATFPMPPAARAQLQFSYSRDPAGAEIALFSCDHFPGLPREKCIPRAR